MPTPKPMTVEEMSAIGRVLDLVDGYLSVEDQDALRGWDGGMMTYQELREHIELAHRVIRRALRPAPKPKARRRR